MKRSKLSAGEKDILDSVERGEWKSIANAVQKKASYKKAAKLALKEHAIILVRFWFA